MLSRIPLLRQALSRPRVQFGILVGVWVLGTAFVFLCSSFGRYSLNNVDAVSYLDIGRQYAAGHVAEALNAYWSPAISWAIVPLIWAGVDAQQSMMLVNAIAGCAASAIGTLFIWRRTQQNIFASAVFLGTSLALALGALTMVTPDLLVVLWATIFICALVWCDEAFAVGSSKRRMWAAILLGVLGAIGYFVKLFLLPVFVATLIAWIVLRIMLRRSRTPAAQGTAHQARRPLIFGAIALAAMVVVMAPWVGALTVKYQSFMVGSSFSVNVTEKFAPQASVHASGRGTDSLVLESPPNKYATHYIEDPTYGIATQTATSTTTGGTLFERVRYYVHQRLEAFPFYINKLGSIAPFAAPMMALIALAMLFGAVRIRSFPSVTLLLLTWSVYFAGYAAIVSVGSGGGNNRYFWPMLVWATMAVCLVWPRFWKRISGGIRLARVRQVLAVVLVALIPMTALFQLVLNTNYPFSTLPSGLGVAAYIQHPYMKPLDRQFADVLKKDGVLKPGDKLASNEFRLARMYAFYDGAQIYGRDRPNNIADPAFQRAMASKGINKYFYFFDPTTQPRDTTTAGTVIHSYVLNFKCPSITFQTTSNKCNLEVVQLNK